MANNACSAAALRRAAVCGTLAASIYNTQPWHFRLTASTLQLWSDPERQLLAHDPEGRLLIMSCGCALFNARAALAAEGIGVSVRRHESDERPSARSRLLATVTVSDDQPADSTGIGDLALVADARRTNRQPFTDADVPADLLQRLPIAALAEGAVLVPLVGDQPRTLRELTERAVAMSTAEPSHRAERRAWSVTAGYSPTPTDDPAVLTDPSGGLPMLLCARTESAPDWMRAGEALQRVLLELTGRRLQAGLSSDAAQVPAIRQRLRTAMGLTVDPIVVLQIGHAPPSPATRRRRLVDVIVESGGEGTVEQQAATA
ncbi:nitroreductase family protein [Microlunatus soli]|uniref:Nitroreductase family protein n=1 Tax=Microlunatus soli TaxID=630515 RepID=A0A1H1NV99_9ACTN|nr:hypothetical protein [Microlunatus soli]SDS02901.1 hypothetical protein SAMN04489812_0662 [Microlunatus soli]